jgi:tripartite-type tricarboxylate transporter receptor subunit TctC
MINTSRRFITAAGLAFGLLSMAYPLSALSETAYPTQRVTLTVGFGPGGPSDIGARFLQKSFRKVTGQDLVIINRPGGAGASAWAAMNDQPADGYNLTLISLPQVILQPGLTPGVGYSFGDLHTVLVYTSVPQVLAVPPNSPYKTLQEFVSAAKERPGRMTVAGTGHGGSNHSAHQLFSDAAGIKTTYIPFSDTASTVAALKGGQTDAAWTWATQGIHDGDGIRMLGLAADERMELFPDLPTVREGGVEMNDLAWWGIGVPRDTPETIREAIAETFARVVMDPETHAEMIAAGHVPMIVPLSEIGGFNEMLLSTYLPVLDALRP